jgi:SAM-dependent methyltransferase
MDEHFIPSHGLLLDDYVARGDANAASHLIRYLWASECLADRPAARRVLDLGCGAGYGAYLLASRFAERSFLAVDYDPAAIEHAEQTYRLPNLTFALGDAMRWSATIGDGELDCVVSFDSIEHVEHRELVMQGIAEHLAQSGCLLFSTPCAWARPLLAPDWEFHKIEYSLATLHDFLRRYFAEIARPEAGTLPHVEVFDRLRGTGLDYLLVLNPVLCERPIAHANPFRPRRASAAPDARSNVRLVAGDWGGWGVDRPGVVDVRTGMAFLVTPTGSNGAPIVFETGVDGGAWDVVAGDWTRGGVDTLGFVDTATGEVRLLDANAPNARRIAFRCDPVPVEAVAVAGDWTGEGVDRVGVYEPTTRIWRLKRANASGPFDDAFFYGPPTDGLVPLAGSWDGRRGDGIGFYMPDTADFYLRSHASQGEPDIHVNFAVPGCRPLAGDWDGDGVATVGVLNSADGKFYLRNANAHGPADVEILVPTAVEV